MIPVVSLPDVRLVTERLVLRPPRESDFDAVDAFMASDRARFVGGPTTDAFDRWRGFLGTVGHWALRGYGMFTVAHDGVPVGRVGIINHAMWPEPELGWHLFDGCEGQGFATEAAIAVRRWAGKELGLTALVSYIAHGNAASIRVAERLGAVRGVDSFLLDGPVQVWRHPSGTGGA